jgi:hypothetical protein
MGKVSVMKAIGIYDIYQAFTSSFSVEKTEGGSIPMQKFK